MTKLGNGSHDETGEEIEALVNPTAHFVSDWINEHVVEKPIEVPQGIDQVAEIAGQCLADAKAEGIDQEEIEAEVGDLEEYIAETIVDEHPASGLEAPRIDKPAPEHPFKP